MRLQGKTAIITGGAAGIGKEIALGYAKEGAEVVVADIKPDGLQSVVQEIETAGGKALAVSADISKKQEVEKMVAETLEKFGKIDILVNNAAIYPAAPFLDIDEEQWCQVIDVNLKGVYLCSQAAAREMAKRKYGKIISITSSQALIGVNLMAHYSAAKGGIISLTKAMASELGSLGINVNAISPGLTTTEHVKEALPDSLLKDIQEGMALRRLGRADDYVGIAVLLASDEGSYITGETIAVDGGFSTVLAVISKGLGITSG